MSDWIIRHQAKIVVTLSLFIGLGLAIYTNHAWEDFYITYRSSKNLALGNGLVFQPGEKVHTFTSPLNVLLPALFSFMAGNRSDTVALWLYRIVCLLAFSATGGLLFRLSKVLQIGRFATIFLLGMVIFEIKMVDFTINGQEVAFMLFFTAMAIWPLLEKHDYPATVLGFAWSGLMWTRPDGFVYAALTGFGFLLFCRQGPCWQNRKELLKIYIHAFSIGALIYLPWFLWAWWYYGTPVPHTIVAKGLAFGSERSFQTILWNMLAFPFSSFSGEASMGLAYSPINVQFGGWPTQLIYPYSIVMSWSASFVWILPKLSSRIKALSWATMGAHIYLTVILKNPYAWYLPVSGMLGLIVLSLGIGEIKKALFNVPSESKKQTGLAWAYRTIRVLATVALLINFHLFTFSAFQLKIQQTIIENGMRKKIGLWLKENADTKHDTVFLECLGYIGYFSQLKMLDMPGLSSPEVVAVRKELKTNHFDEVIKRLQPDWLVLRPSEARKIHDRSPALMRRNYKVKVEINGWPEINKYSWLGGKGYLDFDSRFYIFKRNTSAG